MDTIIIGSMGLDDIKTPFGDVKGVVGGSATYASLAASLFSKPGIVAIIGEDFPKEQIALLEKKGIDIQGLERKGKTFRWQGMYEFDMNEAKTLKTELNSLMDFKPKLPKEYKKAKYVFLGNIDPELQLEVIKQLEKPEVIILDTMNFWISSKKEKLLEVIGKIDLLLINDGEARQLFETTNLVKAAKKALSIGPKAVIIKKGEHGALLFTKDHHFNAPGYPLEDVKDPTGCGDSFGGTLIGYLSKTKDFDQKNIRKGIVYAGCVASFNAEDFSIGKLKTLTMQDVEKRYDKMKEIREF
ncbi:MAG: PfkB family carbohydrate kinase [Nanoarchaeota archaeon]|nr:PfkB family carbohydrate kinase [Nanoarchaeota archaeon]